jgi:predicted DNA-binding protein
MPHVTISFPDELKERAEQIAAEKGISLEEFVRETIERHLKKLELPWSEDPYLANDLVYEGPTPSDVVERLDDYLYGDKE